MDHNGFTWFMEKSGNRIGLFLHQTLRANNICRYCKVRENKFHSRNTSEIYKLIVSRKSQNRRHPKPFLLLGSRFRRGSILPKRYRNIYCHFHWISAAAGLHALLDDLDHEVGKLRDGRNNFLTKRRSSVQQLQISVKDAAL